MRGGVVRVAAVAALLLLVVAGAQLLLGGASATNRRVGSAMNFESGGRAVLRLLLEELGLAPGVWRGAPGELPRSEDLLWLAEAPEVGAEQTTASGPRRLLDPEHYRRFVREGGTLLLPVRRTHRRPAKELLERLFERADLAELELATFTAQVRRNLELEFFGAERVAVDLRALDHFEVLPRTLDVEVLASVVDPRGGSPRPLALRVAFGSGALVLLSDDSFLENDRISREGCALAAVRLVEKLQPRGAIWFDEYAIDGWRPEGWFALLGSPPLLPLTVQALLLALLGVVAVTWVRDFPREPAPLRSVSPRARVRAVAGVYLGGRDYAGCAELLRRHASAELVRRTRRSARGRDGGPTPEEVRAAVSAWAREHGVPERAEAWIELFEGPLPQSARELVPWARRLEAIGADTGYPLDP